MNEIQGKIAMATFTPRYQGLPHRLEYVVGLKDQKDIQSQKKRRDPLSGTDVRENAEKPVNPTRAFVLVHPRTS